MASMEIDEGLPNVEQLKDAVEKMNYVERQEYAVNLVKKNMKKDPSALTGFIADLRGSEPAAPVEIEIDEDLTTLLPTQTMNVAKNFHLHQISLIMANTAKFKDTLLEEVRSPSRLFKKFAVKHWVRLETNVDKLAEVTFAAVPAVQKLLINQLIQQRRVAALDGLAEKLDRYPDVVASFLHGCSSEVVRKLLQDERVAKSKSLRGAMLGKNHWNIILDFLEEQIKESYAAHGDVSQHLLNKYEGWEKENLLQNFAPCIADFTSKFRKTVTQNTDFCKRLMDIALKYPLLQTKSSYGRVGEESYFTFNEEIAKNVWCYPSLFSHFPNTLSIFKRTEDQFIELYKHSYYYPNPEVGVFVHQTDFKYNATFFNVHSIVSPAKGVEITEWFLNTWMQKDQVFVPGFQKPAGYLFDPTWRGKTKRGKNNVIGGVMFCVNKAQTFEQIDAGWVDKLQVAGDMNNCAQKGFRDLGNIESLYSHGPERQLKVTQMILNYFDSIKPGDSIGEIMYYIKWAKHLEYIILKWVKAFKKKGEAAMRKNENLMVNPWIESINLLMEKQNELIEDFKNHSWRQEHESRLATLFQLHKDVVDIREFWNALLREYPGSRPTAVHEEVAKKLDSSISDFYAQIKDKKQNTDPLGGKFKDRYLDYKHSHSCHASSIADMNYANALPTTVPEISEMWTSWKQEFSAMDFTLERVVGRRKRSTLMKNQLDKLEKMVKALIYGDIRATQNYDVIYKDYLYRRFSRAGPETKATVTEQTVNAYLEMMPTPVDENVSKLEKDLYEIRNERWHQLTAALLNGVGRYALKKNKIVLDTGYELYKKTLTTILETWQKNKPEWCFCTKVGEVYTKYIQLFVQNREIHSANDEKRYAPTDSVTQAVNDWLNFVKSLEPTTEEDIEDRWYEWREWLAPQIEALAFSVLKTVVQKQKKVENEKVLEKQKVILREDLEYLPQLGKTLYGECLSMHLKHGKKFEDDTIKKLEPVCEKAKKFVDKITHDLNLRNERWMTQLENAVSKPSNLLSKKQWSPNPIKSNHLVEDLEEAWKRLNTRIVKLLKDKEIADLKKAGEDVKKTEPKTSKKAIFFEKILKTGSSMGKAEALAICETLGLEDVQLENDFYGAVELFLLLGDDLDEEEVLTDETPEIPPVSYATRQQIKKLEKSADIAMQKLTGLFERHRGSRFRTFMDQISLVKGDDTLTMMCLEDSYFQLYPAYNCDNLKHYYHMQLPSDIADLLFGKTTGDAKTLAFCRSSVHFQGYPDFVNDLVKQVFRNSLPGTLETLKKALEKQEEEENLENVGVLQAFYKRLLQECFFNHYLDSYEKDYVNEKLFESEKNAIITKLYKQIGKTREDLVIEFFDQVPTNNDYNAVVELLHKFAKNVDIFRHLFNHLLQFRRAMSERFESIICDLFPKLEDAVLKEELFLEVSSPERMCKLLKNNRMLVYRVLSLGVPQSAQMEQENKSFTPVMRSRTTDIIEALLEDNKNDDQLKDDLFEYFDVTNKKTRRILVKASDSNAIDIRLSNLRRLIKATDITPLEGRETEILRTLRFFCNKVKNEAFEIRCRSVESLFVDISDVTKDIIVKSEQCQQIVLEMLQDFLEAVSLNENSPVETWESEFIKLSKRALILGANDLTSKIIDFAVEIQWRIQKQRLGERPCAKEFLVDLGELSKRYLKLYARKVAESEEEKEKVDIFFPEENDAGFVDTLMECYATRKKEIYAEHMSTVIDQGKHLQPLFRVLGQNWKDNAALQKFFVNLTDEFQLMKFMVEEEGDDESLLHPEIEVLTANVLAGIIKLHPKDWFEIKEFNHVVVAIFDALKELHSRGKDKCLGHSQSSILFFLRYTFRWFLDQYYLRLEGEKVCEGTPLGEEWKSQPLMKTVVEKCFDILQEDTYPNNGPFMWSIQFEIHLAFRWAMTELDKKVMKLELLRKQSPQELLGFYKIPLFVQYWDTLVKNMDHVLTNGAPPLRVKDVINLDGVQYKRVAEEEERTMFSADEEREVYMTESVVWALDCLNQYCLGGTHGLGFDYRRMKFLKITLTSMKLLQNPSGFHQPPCAWRWYEIPQFVKLADLSLQLLSTGWEKDMDGLLIVPEKHFVTMFFQRVIFKYHNPNTSAAKNEKPGYVHWSDLAVLKKFADTLMTTRTCVKFVWNIYSHLTADKKGKELWQARDEFVNILLKISPSAIYVPLVWRHLVLHRQDLLATYLDQLGRPHFGLFYLPSSIRPKTKIVAGTPGTSHEPSIDSDWGNCIKRIPLELEAMTAFETELEEWKSEEHGAGDKFDNKEIWSFPACYKLNRLTPDALGKIYEQKLSEAMNKSRPMAERVSAIQRLTLLPSTDLADITALIDDADIDWGTNIKERLIRGTIQIDEITAGAHYVLQPKLLSEQMARVAAFCVDPILNYIPRTAFTKLMQLILSGTRRKKMKVTAYKQMIRLLLRRVTPKHIRIFVREWNRGEVHRDIRVVMIKAALELLRAENPAPYVLKAVWHILESTVAKKDMTHQEELITVVMGASGIKKALESNILKKDRLQKHFAELESETIAQKYIPRFVQRVLLPTCSRLHRLARKNRDDVYIATPVVDGEEEKKEDNKMEIEEEEDDFVLVDEEDYGEEKKPVAEEEKKEVTRSLGIKIENDAYAGEIWTWRGGVREAGYIYSNWKSTNLLVDNEGKVVIGDRDQPCKFNKWIDVNGYICTEDESCYLAATKDENGAPIGLHLEPVSDEMPLHPEISFRSDGQIVFNQHEQYTRSEDDLPFMALQLVNEYLQGLTSIDEVLRVRVARLCFEIITDTSLEMTNHPQQKYIETMKARFTLACKVLSSSIKAIDRDENDKKIRHFDERYVQFFERTMDILFTRLLSAEDSEIRSGLNTLMTSFWDVVNTTFGSKRFMLQLIQGRKRRPEADIAPPSKRRRRTALSDKLPTGKEKRNAMLEDILTKSFEKLTLKRKFNDAELGDENTTFSRKRAKLENGYFAMNYSYACAIFKNWLTAQSASVFRFDDWENLANPTVEEIDSVLIPLYNFLGWEMEQLCSSTSMKSRQSSFSVYSFNKIDSNLALWNKVIKRLLKTLINDEIPVSEEIRAMPLYKKKLANLISAVLGSSHPIEYTKDMVEPYWKFLTEMVVPNIKDVKVDYVIQLSTYSWGNLTRVKLHEGANEIQKRFWKKLFALFPGKKPLIKDQTEEQKAWLLLFDHYLNQLVVTSNEVWYHANQDYILPILSLVLRIAKPNIQKKSFDVMYSFGTLYLAKVKQNRKIEFEYEEGCPVLQLSELLVSDILDVANAEQYNFDHIRTLLQGNLIQHLKKSSYFHYNLQNIMDLLYNYDTKRVVTKEDPTKPDPSYVFTLIKKFFDVNLYESWPQLEAVVATFVSRASEADATLYDRNLGTLLITKFPTLMWNQNSENFMDIANFMVETSQLQLEDADKKQKEKEAKESMLEKEREKKRRKNTFEFPPTVIDAARTVLNCVQIPLGDREIKTLPESGKNVVRQLMEQTLSIQITNWKDLDFKELTRVFPGLYLFLHPSHTNLFVDVYREDDGKLLQIFEHVMNLYVKHPFGFRGFKKGADSLVKVIENLVNHTKHCDSYESCYVPLMQLIVNIMMEETEKGSTDGANYTSLWFHICKYCPLLVLEYLNAVPDSVPSIYNTMYTVAKTFYHDENKSSDAKSKYMNALLQLPMTMLSIGYPNHTQTRVIGPLVPTMVKVLLDRVKEDCDKFGALLMNSNNLCRFLNDIIIPLSVGAVATTELILYLAQQKEFKNTEQNNSTLSYLMRGLLAAFSDNEKRVDAFGDEDTAQHELTVVIHEDTVREYQHIADFIDENSFGDKAEISSRLLDILQQNILVSRSYAGLVDRMWLSQQEEFWFSVMWMTCSDKQITEDSTFNCDSAAKNLVNILKAQMWYNLDGYCDTIEDFGQATTQILRYIQHITNWHSNHPYGVELFTKIRFELTKFLGYMSCGCGDSMETESLGMDDVTEGETYLITDKQEVILASEMDLEVGHQLKGKEVILKTKGETDTVVVVLGEDELTVPLMILREPANKVKAGKIKYVWFDEFIKLLEPFQNAQSSSIRNQALTQLTTYRSKQAWSAVDNEVALRIRVNEPKKKKKGQNKKKMLRSSLKEAVRGRNTRRRRKRRV